MNNEDDIIEYLKVRNILTNRGRSFICEVCKKKTSFNELYDSYFCKECDRWNEKACNDPKCYHCSKRPDKPSKAQRAT